MTGISTFTIYFILNNFIRGFSGRKAQGAILQYLSKYDEILSEDLHSGNSKRTYSLSPILFNKINGDWEGRISIHTKDERIIKAIMSLIIQNKYGEIYIKDSYCPVTKIEFNQKLIPNVKSLPKNYTFKLKFTQPTYFSNGYRASRTDAYPHLHKIWMDMLNTYDLLINEINIVDKKIVLEKLLNQISTPKFSFRSEHVILNKNIRITCFKGYFLFKVENTDHLDILIPLLEVASVWGIGGKRAMGFGRINIKVYENKDRKNKSYIPNSNKSKQNNTESNEKKELKMELNDSDNKLEKNELVVNIKGGNGNGIR